MAPGHISGYFKGLFLLVTAGKANRKNEPRSLCRLSVSHSPALTPAPLLCSHILTNLQGPQSSARGRGSSVLPHKTHNWTTSVVLGIFPCTKHFLPMNSYVGTQWIKRIQSSVLVESGACSPRGSHRTPKVPGDTCGKPLVWIISRRQGEEGRACLRAGGHQS